MALQATRALRGTKTLTRAFFDAADTIRDELKMAREKAKSKKDKITATATKSAPVAVKVASKRKL
jgi:flagellar capping protein FliD